MEFDGLLDEIDFSIEYDDLECRDFQIVNASLENLLTEIRTHGVSKNDMIAYTTITHQEPDPNYPLASYTVLPSQINITVACENIIKSIFSGIVKIFQFIFRMISAFFAKIGAFFRWLAGGSNKNDSGTRGGNSAEKKDTQTTQERPVEKEVREKKGVMANIKAKFKKDSKKETALPPSPVTKKDKAIIKAIETNSSQGKEGNAVFENVINDKVVSADSTELLLQNAVNDSEQNKYVNVKSILEPFYGRELTDNDWDRIVNAKKGQLNTLVKALLGWWNTSHPIVTSSSNLADKFSHEVIEVIDVTVDSLNEGMQWWVSECRQLATMDVESYLKKADSVSMTVKKRKEDLQKELVEKANRALSAIPFVKTKITEDVRATMDKAFDEFKNAKTPQRSKIDFLQGLKEVQWLKELSGLSNKIEDSDKKTKKYKNDLERIINDLEKGYKESDKAIVTELGHFLKAMHSENQRFIGFCFKLAGFLKVIDGATEKCRSTSATVHSMLVAMGNGVKQDLKKAS